VDHLAGEISLILRNLGMFAGIGTEGDTCCIESLM
jgi:hypothetical protein